jgi:glutamine synthetase
MIKKKIVTFILLSFFFHHCLGLDQESLLDACKSYHTQNIEFCFYDFLGIQRKSINVPVNTIEDINNYLENGISFDGSSILGCTRITNSDMLLMPDLSTPTRRIPWTYDHTSSVRVMCTMYLDKKTPYYGDPRVILQRELNTLHAMGYDLYIGPEIEFYVFEKKSKDTTPIDHNSYADATNDISLSNALVTIVHVLNELELNVEKIHHEVGNSQFEISLKRNNALIIADSILMAKDALTSLVRNYDKKISFMPKPLANKPGSGMHLNFSLFDLSTLTNAFYDEQEPNKLSHIAQSFIAGVLKHVAEFTLILNPTINSYKRLGGHEAPKFICCGDKNRSALIRLPNCNDQAGAVRAEIRSPDAWCNPYLAFAALLRAGIEGIKNNYTLPKIVKENLYTVDKSILDQENIIQLPASFQEAITAFENSTLMRELLGDVLFFNYLDYKKRELEDFNNSVTNWELDHYL